jgi:hypothetical protein
LFEETVKVSRSSGKVKLGVGSVRRDGINEPRPILLPPLP